MIAKCFSLGFAALVLCAGGPIEASAQSFDCTKASTPVERLICADQKLGALDAELAGEVKKTLAALPARRDDLLVDERRWVKERDKSCAPPVKTLEGEARARAIACLTDSYEDRIAVVRSAGAVDWTEICRRVAGRYGALLNDDLLAPAKKSFYADSPLDTLTAAAGSGVTAAKPVAEFDDYSRPRIVDWAKGQPQPFTIPEDVSKAIDEITQSHLRIDRLPGANYYASSVVEGTAACYSAVYFEEERGRAKLVGGPPGWESENGGGCGVTRSFGMVDKTPVAFEERHDYTPSLASALSITPWNGKRFDPACRVTFEFAPRFDAHAKFNTWSENCDGADCDALRRAALALVEAAQNNPLEAQKAAIARLTAAQRAQFTSLKQQAGPPEPVQANTSSDPSDPASYTDGAPLLLPLVHDGRVYLAALGHFTIGWRIFSDWSATLRRLENGKAAERATFAIGMTKGRLEDISVK